MNAASASQSTQVVSASQHEASKVLASFRPPSHPKARATEGRLNQRKERLCCSRRASDRYGILWKAACEIGAKGEYGMRHVSAAAVQADLCMGSDVEKTVIISGQGARTMRRHRNRALCSKVGV